MSCTQTASPYWVYKTPNVQLQHSNNYLQFIRLQKVILQLGHERDIPPSLSNLTNKKPKLTLKMNLILTTSVNKQSVLLCSGIRQATPVFCRVKSLVCDEFKESIIRASVTCLTLQSEKKSPLHRDPFHHVSGKNKHFS